jgi:hypothetical protein
MMKIMVFTAVIFTARINQTYSVLKVTKLLVSVCSEEIKAIIQDVLASHFQKMDLNRAGKYLENVILSNQLINDKTLIIKATQGSLTIGVPVDKKIGVAIIKPIKGVVIRIIGSRLLVIS